MNDEQHLKQLHEAEQLRQRRKAESVLLRFNKTLVGQERPLGDIAEHAYSILPTPGEPLPDTVRGSFRLDTLWLIAELLEAQNKLDHFKETS